MRIAIIPARGGSKRIPHKNIRDFCGKPMLCWSISAAQESGCFDRVMVSTDDAEIAEIAKTAGAEVPFMRPAALSDDHTGTIPVIAHAIDATAPEATEVCCIYATAPFVQPADILRGLQELRNSQATFVFSATSYAFPIQRAMRITCAGRVEMFQPEHASTRSQDLEEAYHDAGQFYWGSAQSWRQEAQLIAPHANSVLLPRHRVQDIDTLEDWQQAEALFKTLQHLAADTSST